ncbi:hypothetical protein CC78DRAFT_420555, partial [Lojkania enalia]
MSFGFSPTDIVTLVSLTTKAYQGWRNACGEYGDITNTLFSFQIVLKRVHRHVQNPDQEDARPFLADENTLSNDLQLVLSSSNRTNLVENKSTDSASAFTTYEQDSKEVWRELRREMIRLGFKSDDVSANKGALLAFARSL